MPRPIIAYRKDRHVALLIIAENCTSGVKLGKLKKELSDLRIRVMSDEDVRVILLTGLNHKEFLMEENSVSEEKLNRIRGLDVEIANMDRPIIAGINGDVSGLGLEMALACDVRVASDTARFGFRGIKVGFIPCNGGTQRLPRLVGKAKAMEMILSGCMIDAQEALKIGLVTKVVRSDGFFEAVSDIAQEMASKAPVALRYAKEAINKGMDLSLEQGLRLEADLYLLLHTTRDRMEGIRAFQERRKAEFQGR